jgi:NAD dependent epimerase/dehydratase family.
MLYITGITGHSGRWLLKRLDQEGYKEKIRCVMRQSKENKPDKYKAFDNCGLDLEFVVGNLEDENFLAETLKGVETVVHISGIGFSPKIIAAAISNNVNWVILVHTTGRYSKYKSASEEYIKIEDGILKLCEAVTQNKRTLNCTVLRPTMIYGSSMDKNMYRLVGYLAKHRFFPLFGDGSNLMQPVHARDLGNAYYQVLTHPEATMNRSYNLSGKEPITYVDIIKTICRQLNKKPVIVKLPIALSIFAAKVYNTFFKNAVISVEQVMRMQEDKAFGYEAARADFGYSPMSFEDGAREEVDEYLRGVRVDFSNIKYQ